MFLKELQLTNFGKYEEQHFDLKKINILCGPNGAGKSTILEAINFLLTGKGKKTGSLPGGALVTGKLDDFVISRSTEGTLKINGKKVTQKAYNNWFIKTYGMDVSAVQISTASELLKSMQAKEVSEFLIKIGIIPGGVSMKNINTLLSIPTDVQTKLREALEVTDDEAEIDFGQLCKCHKLLYDRRTVAKSKLKGLKDATLSYEAVEMRSKEAVQADITAQHKERAAAETVIQRQRMWEIAAKNFAAWQNSVKQMEDQINAMPVLSVDATQREILASEQNRLLEEIARLSGEIIGESNSLKSMNHTLEALSQPVCPLSRNIFCTCDKTDVRDELQERADKMKNHLRILDAQVKTDKTTVENIKQQIAKMDADLIAASRRANLEKLLHERYTQKPEMPEKLEEKATYSPERLESLEREMAQILIKEEYEKKLKEIPVVEKEIDMLTQLIVLLAPNSGIQEAVLNAVLSCIENCCNEVAQTLLGKENLIALTADNGIHISAHFHEAQIPYEEVSSGEQCLCTFLVVNAINNLTKNRILCIDNLDMLDTENQKKFLQFIERVTDFNDYDSIFIAMVDHADTKEMVKTLLTSNSNINSIPV